jgi:hypothetical protein
MAPIEPPTPKRRRVAVVSISIEVDEDDVTEALLISQTFHQNVIKTQEQARMLCAVLSVLNAVKLSTEWSDLQELLAHRHVKVLFDSYTSLVGVYGHVSVCQATDEVLFAMTKRQRHWDALCDMVKQSYEFSTANRFVVAASKMLNDAHQELVNAVLHLREAIKDNDGVRNKQFAHFIRDTACPVCNQPMDIQDESATVSRFRCNHGAHTTCIDDEHDVVCKICEADSTEPDVAGEHPSYAYAKTDELDAIASLLSDDESDQVSE